MQNISYLVVVKYLAILTGIYDFLNYSIVLLYSMYYNTSRTLNKSVNEESEIFDAIVTHESSDMYHHHDICEKDQFYKYYCVRIILNSGEARTPNFTSSFARQKHQEREFYTLQKPNSCLI